MQARVNKEHWLSQSNYTNVFYFVMIGIWTTKSIHHKIQLVKITGWLDSTVVRLVACIDEIHVVTSFQELGQLTDRIWKECLLELYNQLDNNNWSYKLYRPVGQ